MSKPRKMAVALVVAMIFFTAVSVFSQYTTINGVPNQGLQIGGGATYPPACKLRDLWIKTGASAGFYSCTTAGTPGTWTALSGTAGPPGTAATVAVGTTTTGAAGTSAIVTNSGTSSAAVFNFTIPRGDTGASGSGGSGVATMTTGAGTPTANCTAPSSSNIALYFDTTNQDVWFCYAANLWKKLISTTGSGPYVFTGTTGGAQTAPAAGQVTCWLDTTAKTQKCIAADGTVTAMVDPASLSGGGAKAYFSSNYGGCSASNPPGTAAFNWSVRGTSGSFCVPAGETTQVADNNVGTANFNNAATDNDYVTTWFRLPANYAGGTISFGASMVPYFAGNASMRGKVATKCVGNAVSMLAANAYNAAQNTNTITANATNNYLLTISSLTTTGCNAGDMMFVRFMRDNTVSSNDSGSIGIYNMAIEVN